MIKRSEHSFREGEASTRITAQWVSELNDGDNSSLPPDGDKLITNSLSAKSRCKTRNQKQVTSIVPKKTPEGEKDTVAIDL